MNPIIDCAFTKRMSTDIETIKNAGRLKLSTNDKFRMLNTGELIKAEYVGKNGTVYSRFFYSTKEFKNYTISYRRRFHTLLKAYAMRGV